MRKERLLLLLVLAGLSTAAQTVFTTDVLVIGGGTGGTAAGIQSARVGARTIIAEAGPWLGGMISSAGVSATDGNHRLPSGMWAEFRNELYKVYGGPKGVETGWVSNTLFEPHVADSIFKRLAASEKKLTVLFGYQFISVIKRNDQIVAARFMNKRTGKPAIIKARIFIDATELGDVIKSAGLAYDLGMEADSRTHEHAGVSNSNSIIQDLTYVATLKDYGSVADKTIPVPINYDPKEFDGACTDYYVDRSRKAPTVDGKKMLDYGRLPHNKFMINWPAYGNDTYLNVVELNEKQREKELEAAKQTTLRFIYFIQHQLGFRNLGLADDEYPTKDGLALIPYYREGRRVKGMARLTARHIAAPFAQEPLYRTGIAVGDYPIDHHHKKNPSAPQHLDFYPVPSFNVPLGSLIPRKHTNLIVAEKAISVSNIANGTTRLQPCVLLTGQAAGTLAALSSLKKVQPYVVPVRTVQEKLLDSKAYLMPYVDVTPERSDFTAIQKIGATGILKGKGIPNKWANQTWFYPDSLVETESFILGLNEFKAGDYRIANTYVRIEDALLVTRQINPEWTKGKHVKQVDAFAEANWAGWGLKNFDRKRSITRAELAVLLEHTAQPFEQQDTDYNGYYKTTNKIN